MKENERKEKFLRFVSTGVIELKGKQGRVLTKTLFFVRKKKSIFILLWVAEKWRKLEGKRILGFCLYR